MPAVLTLPPWVKEGQQVISAYRPTQLMHNPGVHVLGTVRIGQTMWSSWVTIKRPVGQGFISNDIPLEQLLSDWRPYKGE